MSFEVNVNHTSLWGVDFRITVKFSFMLFFRVICYVIFISVRILFRWSWIISSMDSNRKLSWKGCILTIVIVLIMFTKYYGDQSRAKSVTITNQYFLQHANIAILDVIITFKHVWFLTDYSKFINLWNFMWFGSITWSYESSFLINTKMYALPWFQFA